MSLKILCAGCAKEEREQAETAVKKAMAQAPALESWLVSLVKMQGRWSVTIDGPRLKGLTLMAPEGRLRESIQEALARGPSPAAPGSAPGIPQGGRHACDHCGRAFRVIYEGRPGEPTEMAPVACPHCWRINHVSVGSEAAATRDYRAEKAGP